MKCLEKLKSYITTETMANMINQLLGETKPTLQAYLRDFKKHNDKNHMLLAEINETVIQFKKDKARARKMFTRIENRVLNK